MREFTSQKGFRQQKLHVSINRSMPDAIPNMRLPNTRIEILRVGRPYLTNENVILEV
jgi:hypothetical protein